MPQTLEDVTFEDMRYCVRREVRMRKRVYKGLVANDKMTQDEAQWEIACMQSVQDLLEKMIEKQLALL